jgi:hypothetical protein
VAAQPRFHLPVHGEVQDYEPPNGLERTSTYLFKYQHWMRKHRRMRGRPLPNDNDRRDHTAERGGARRSYFAVPLGSRFH